MKLQQGHLSNMPYQHAVSLLSTKFQLICLDSKQVLGISNGLRANKLKLNPDKTEMLQVSRKVDEGLRILSVLDGVTLPLKTQVHSSGVLLDSCLSLDVQVSAVARSAFAQLKLVHLFLEMSDLATVTHALVTSCLDYRNATCKLNLQMEIAHGRFVHTVVDPWSFWGCAGYSSISCCTLE